MDQGKGYKHGFSEAVWQRAKDEAREAMVKRARRGSTLTYTDLCSKISAIQFDPDDTRLPHLLGQISTEEDQAGRGMLTAVMVHKEDGQPGNGFFELAQLLGRSVADKERMWIQELSRLKDFYA